MYYIRQENSLENKIPYISLWSLVQKIKNDL